jgi:hypothetical protein
MQECLLVKFPNSKSSKSYLLRLQQIKREKWHERSIRILACNMKRPASCMAGGLRTTICQKLPETPFVVRRTPNVGMVGRAAELTLIRQIQPLEVASAAGDLARLSLRFEPMRHVRWTRRWGCSRVSACVRRVGRRPAGAPAPLPIRRRSGPALADAAGRPGGALRAGDQVAGLGRADLLNGPLKAPQNEQ